MTNNSGEQSHFWQVSDQNQTYTELCNALYAREMQGLAHLTPEYFVSLQARLASLPFYIPKAASYILQQQSPLSLDSQNASWFSRQAGVCPARKQQADPIAQFYQKAAKPGLIVPVYITRLAQESILLDSIDEVDYARQQIHCNEHGWFAFSGTPLQAENSDKFLLKPDKAIMTAACCGHQWLKSDKNTPRTLSLRELLLASRLNWRNFARPQPAPKL